MTEDNKKTFQPANPTAAPAPSPARPSDARPSFGPRRRMEVRRKVCKLCADDVERLDYKNSQLLRTFTMDSGKILSRRITGACAKHQRQITRAIKRNRNLAILPYAIK